MREGRRLAVPWYRYPPFSEERIGGLSVAVWEVTRELGKLGVCVDILTPVTPAAVRDKAPGVTVIASRLGEKLFKNQRLDKDDEQSLEDYDAILSVANYAAKSLRSSKRVVGRVSRQIHAVGQDRALSTYVSLRPGISEYLRMTRAKWLDQMNLQALKGTKTLCVSQYIKSKMQDALEDPRNLLLIPNGIQTEKFKPMQQAKRYDIIFIGRFQKSKGLDILLRALALLATKARGAYKLGIVGSFSVQDRNYLLQTVPSTVKEGIGFLGSVRRDELPSVINRSKIVVVPSRYESFGLPALEAIACGVPVIAAQVGGLPEIVDDSVGMLVEPDNHHALAEAIENSLKSSDLCNKVVTSGPAKARTYEWDIVAPQLERTIFR